MIALDVVVNSLKLMYEETMEKDRTLKDVAVKTAGDHVKELVNREEFVDLCKANGEVDFDILKASLTPSLKPCPWHSTTGCVEKSNYLQNGNWCCARNGRYFN